MKNLMYCLPEDFFGKVKNKAGNLELIYYKICLKFYFIM